MESGFDGRVALVFGGGSGIGRATALRFAAEGASVVISGRRLAQLEQVVREIEELGGTAKAHRADISVPDDVDASVSATVKTFGGVHAVANCAAVVNRTETMLTGTLDDFDQVLNVNLRGAWLLIRAAAKAMIEAGDTGSMVTVSSINALRPGTVDYSTSKAGVEGLTRAAANLLGSHGIRINAVRSGFVDTELLRYAWNVPPDVPFPLGQGYEANVPLGRVGQPEETAAAIVWLCSQSASYVTGTCLDVDGGALTD